MLNKLVEEGKVSMESSSEINPASMLLYLKIYFVAGSQNVRAGIAGQVTKFINLALRPCMLDVQHIIYTSSL